MMRRGLWQQKHKRPSSCLLCRCSSSYPGPSTRPYSAVAGVAGNGQNGLGSAANPRRPSSLGASRGPVERSTPQRNYAGPGLPSWATQQPTQVAGDGLLPHERAAKERAAQERAAREQEAREKAAREQEAREKAQRLEALKAAKEKAIKDELAKRQAAREQAMRERAEQREQAARERAARAQGKRKQPPQAMPGRHTQPVQDAKPTRPTQDAKPTRPTQDARSTQPIQDARPTQPIQDAKPTQPVRDTKPTQPTQDAKPTQPVWDIKPASQPTVPVGTSPLARALSPSWASTMPSWSSTPQATPTSDLAKPDPYAGLLPHERAAREKAAASRAQQASRSRDVPIQRYNLGKPDDIGFPSVSGGAFGQPRKGEGEWGNLTRRRRNHAQGYDMSRPLDPQRPVLGTKLFDPRPSSPASGKAPRQAQQRSTTGTSGEDQWSLLERSVEEKPNARTQAATGPNTWGWADEYTEEARQLKVQKIAREAEKVQVPEQEFVPSQRESRPYRRDDRYRRDDVERREKPKKAKPRRREQEDDDDFDEDYYEQRRQRRAEKAERERQKLAALEAAGPIPIFLPEYISVSNLAEALNQKVDVFLTQLEELGFEDVGKDNILTGETAALVAQEYGFEPTVDTGKDEDLKPRPPPEDPSSLPLRPPVVTIMGHVDHGKTTLLDYLRKSSIVAQEHGGITQHIGAFSVSMSTGKQITFLDTPGHAAFLSMRQRGANVTDMVILVVAADDSVMPQTLEALKHARAAKVPIIVAINKVDKPEANVDRVKSDLATNGVEIEDYGGDVQVVCVSGRTGQGMGDLEENILLLSEMLDIRAEPDGLAEGWVLESTIKPIGRVATVLVKRGTLRPGDFIVAGRVHAKVRSLRNEAGVEVDEAPPGTAVEVLGWKEPPSAGDMILQAPDEARAKEAVHYRQELFDRGEIIDQMAQQEIDRQKREREREIEKITNPPRRRGRHGPLPAPTPTEEAPTPDEDAPPSMTLVNFTVKGDVHGSVEAVTAAILEQGNNEVRARVLHAGPGQITEWDVEHAAVANSTIVNFNNTVPGHIKRMAAESGVRIMEHNVIYHLVEEVRERLVDALPPLVIKKVVGEAEVLQVFPINVRGRVYKNIAGCRIGNGKVMRNAKARVIRGGENIFEGTIETLKHVKKDVNEMKKGQECGLSFKDWDELQEGDHVQVIEEITEKRKL